jgi:hypothetical protein
MKSSIFWDITPHRIWGSHRSGYKEFYLLGYNTVQHIESQSTSTKLCLPLASSWFLAWLIFLTWRRRRNVPPKRWMSFNGLHDVISQKTELFRILYFLKITSEHNSSQYPFSHNDYTMAWWIWVRFSEIATATSTKPNLRSIQPPFKWLRRDIPRGKVAGDWMPRLRIREVMYPLPHTSPSPWPMSNCCHLEGCWGSVVVSCCCWKLVAEAGGSWGTERKGVFAFGSRYQTTPVKT